MSNWSSLIQQLTRSINAIHIKQEEIEEHQQELRKLQYNHRKIVSALSAASSSPTRPSQEHCLPCAIPPKKIRVQRTTPSASVITTSNNNQNNWTTFRISSVSLKDRVFIKNRVTPFFKSPTSADRKATVTNIQGTKIFLTTDSGRKTWRLLKNVQGLNEQ